MSLEDKLVVTDEDGLQKANQVEELLRLRYLSALRKILLTPEGCLVLRGLMSDCFTYETTWSNNNSQFARNEGRRSVLLGLQSDMAELVARGMMKPEELVPFLIKIDMEEKNG